MKDFQIEVANILNDKLQLVEGGEMVTSYFDKKETYIGFYPFNDQSWQFRGYKFHFDCDNQMSEKMKTIFIEWYNDLPLLEEEEIYMIKFSFNIVWNDNGERYIFGFVDGDYMQTKTILDIPFKGKTFNGFLRWAKKQILSL